jgi:hypothetical protein
MLMENAREGARKGKRREIEKRMNEKGEKPRKKVHYMRSFAEREENKKNRLKIRREKIEFCKFFILLQTKTVKSRIKYRINLRAHTHILPTLIFPTHKLLASYSTISLSPHRHPPLHVPPTITLSTTIK